MFYNYPNSFKSAFFVILAIHSPIVPRNVLMNGPALPEVSWSYRMLFKACEEMGISVCNVEAYAQFVSSLNSTMRFQSINAMCAPFLEVVRNFNYPNVAIIIEIMVFLISEELLDANGRVLMFNLMKTFPIDELEYLSLELNIKKYFEKHRQYFQPIQNSTDENVNKGREKMMRYAKIGAATIGAGAILALTGGLAAPALAAAVGMSLSATACATVFGSAGASLAGYKMLKRTRGLTDFQFEDCGNKEAMSLAILVPGFMYYDEDDRRVYGQVPAKMSLQERLVRYLQVVDQTRLLYIDDEISDMLSDPSRYFQRLKDTYSITPLKDKNLVPKPKPWVLSEESITSIIKVLSQRRLTIAALPSIGSKPKEEKEEEIDPNDFKEIDLKSNDDCIDPTANVSKKSNSSKNTKQDEVNDTVEFIVEDSKSLFGLDYWHWNTFSRNQSYEVFLLRWERSLLQELGQNIVTLAEQLGAAAAQQVLASTVFAAIAAAVLWPVLVLKVTDSIDNIWTVASIRADLAGKELAKALISRPQGSKPVTLIGYSFGARVIFSCLKELFMLRFGHILQLKKSPYTSSLSASSSKKISSSSSMFRIFGRRSTTDKNSQQNKPTDLRDEDRREEDELIVDNLVDEADTNFYPKNENEIEDTDDVEFSRHNLLSEDELNELWNIPEDFRSEYFGIENIVEDVVLLGIPIRCQSHFWKYIKLMVSGRLINGYSPNDLVLGVVYRYQRMKSKVAGFAEVPCEGVENINLSDLVKQHTDYARKMKEILEFVHLSSKTCYSYDGLA